MYEPKNTFVDDVLPPALPKDFLEATYYHYRDFPKPYWKRYLVAKRFVDCRQAKTPKLIKSGLNTKFFVMENSSDYRMDFYDGCSVHEG
ncbi:hypothetical protein AVEN_206456-1 [Araneus ventricosus]|uniref:Cryptic POLO box 1 (CPB1) domain-containing protein n=1 Tax=Araneus ventricosus TaxID=182803 RepID=A0A4Y2P2X6_ARAVE|nr:hypothetical protein AVEN_206456-1 [Araneus ventricosus]